MRRNESSTCETKTAAIENDVFPSLQQERILFLTSEINTESANILCGQMMLLDLQDSTQDITLFINSEGGMVTDTMAIYDVMQAISCDVSTICIGEAASGAAVLLSGGTKGKRYILPNARLMLHQPQGGVEGSTRDVEIEAKELLRLRELLSRVFEKHTGLDESRLHTILDRDTYLSAERAVELGLVDQIINTIPVSGN